MPETHGFTLNRIADNSQQFSDFAPYVASVNNQGTVAFQAAMRAGGTGIFLGDRQSITTVADTSGDVFSHFISHPDIDSAGNVSVYTELKSGGQAVALFRTGQSIILADTHAGRKTIGPLGPTMNDSGTVAFRADLATGESGIFSGDRESVQTIATTRALFDGFQGLPVINNGGTVAFRADLQGGGQGIYTVCDGVLSTIATTHEEFREFDLFPSINDAGVVAFSGVRKTGEAGVFTVQNGAINTVVTAADIFASFRGSFINNVGRVVYAATPHSGQLGIYAGPDPIRDRILSFGDLLFGAAVTGFALNPVSVNDAGQIAIRVALADDRQFILRADPVVAPC